jgi:tRNA modification GTPase
MRVRVSSNLEQLLAAVVELGARIAEPGGFTRRAVASGKLDLLRAEAVLEVIHACSERAWRLAQANLGGRFGDDTSLVVRCRPADAIRLDLVRDPIDPASEMLAPPRRAGDFACVGANPSSTYRSGSAPSDMV